MGKLKCECLRGGPPDRWHSRDCPSFKKGYERHDFKKGDWVFVINQRLDRSYFVEGKAQIVKPDPRNENCYLVRMKEREGWETYSRYVDPAAQRYAENYAFQLNQQAIARDAVVTGTGWSEISISESDGQIKQERRNDFLKEKE